jgi:hypothetical protein
VTNFVIFHLTFQTLLAGHFFLFNFIYYSQIDPCFGKTSIYLGFKHNVLYGSTYYLFQNGSTFSSVYAAVYIAQLLICIAYLIVIGCNQHMPYNRVLSPLTVFGTAWFIFFLIVRMGAILHGYYYPS